MDLEVSEDTIPVGAAEITDIFSDEGPQDEYKKHDRKKANMQMYLFDADISILLFASNLVINE